MAITPTASGAVSREEIRRWDKLVADLPFQELPNIRAGAAKWAGTISALTGVSTVVGLIKGDEIGKLTHAMQYLVAVVIFLALALAVAGIYLAAIASQGSPRLMWTDALSYRTFSKRQARDAVEQLRWSRRAVLGAVLLAACAILLIWFGPKASPTEIKAMVIRKAGTVSCGTLVTDATGNLSLKPKQGNPQPIGLNDVGTLTIVSTCP